MSGLQLFPLVFLVRVLSFSSLYGFDNFLKRQKILPKRNKSIFIVALSAILFVETSSAICCLASLESVRFSFKKILNILPFYFSHLISLK